jgi:recombination DNA repair RAD52 pathway protein
MSLTPEQYMTLRKPLNTTRVAKRSQGGKQLSYLEAWDVRAHLIRVFGYGNFDIETVEQNWIASREYMSTPREGDPKPMVEVSWMAKVRLTIRDTDGARLCRYTETAVGSTSGPASMIGEHHDNAVKTAASDALKRCAINLGTQFGLSLYDDGSTRDVVRGTLVKPEGIEEQEAKDAAAAVEVLERTLGSMTPVDKPPVAPEEPRTAPEYVDEHPQDGGKAVAP